MATSVTTTDATPAAPSSVAAEPSIAATVPVESESVKQIVVDVSAPALLKFVEHPSSSPKAAQSSTTPDDISEVAESDAPVDVKTTKVSKPVTLSPSAPVYVPPSILAKQQQSAIAASVMSIEPATPTRARPLASALRTPRTPASRTPTSRSRATIAFAPTTPASPSSSVELSAKQVRELRRLCRKTANRAEYEGRLVQLRQIASILAMGGPSLVHFAPSYLAADSAMQAWIDATRAAGADWRDERPLSVTAIEELREWDRLLKSWARRRFPTLDTCSEGAAPPTTPRSKRPDILSLSSPVAGDSPSPSRAGQVVKQVRTPASNRRHVSRMSISKDGDIINISIVRAEGRIAMSANNDANSPSSWRAGSPAKDQENISPVSDGEKSRDWGTLRKAAKEAAESTANTALKPRNW